MDIITKIILISIIIVGLTYMYISADMSINPCNYPNMTTEIRC